MLKSRNLQKNKSILTLLPLLCERSNITQLLFRLHKDSFDTKAIFICIFILNLVLELGKNKNQYFFLEKTRK